MSRIIQGLIHSPVVESVENVRAQKVILKIYCSVYQSDAEFFKDQNLLYHSLTFGRTAQNIVQLQCL